MMLPFWWAMAKLPEPGWDLAAERVPPDPFGKELHFPRPELSQHLLFQPFKPVRARGRIFLGRLRAIRKLPCSPCPALRSSRMKPNICFRMGGFWSWLHMRAPGRRLEFWPFWVIVFEAGPPRLLPSPCSADSKARPCHSWHLLCC